MKFNRRKAVQLGTVATFGSILPRFAVGAADQNQEFETAFEGTLTDLKAVFSKFGFDENEPLSIVTGNEDYNGGLRHDFDQSALPAERFVIQPLARVGDVAEKHRADILPLFHEVGCHPVPGSDGQTTTRLMIGILTEELGLDPSRIAFVSVPQSLEVRPVLDELGLPFLGKVLVREEAAALAARDASGFFFPDPFGDAYQVTMGVYYRIGPENEVAPLAYPPSANWTEIGEIVIAGDAAPLGISIGAERLTYALTGLFPTWEQRLGALFQQVEADTAGEPQPPGLAKFR